MGRAANNNVTNTRLRFSDEEVEEMEKLLRENNGLTPSRSVQEQLAEKFGKGARREPVQRKQIWNWFQNRRYKLSKMVDKADPGAGASSSGRNSTAEQLLAQRANGLQFEAMSSKDGAWYDIRCFLEHKHKETGPEVLVRYAGLEGDEEEWVELKSVRRRSLPCEGDECLAVLPGDNILCFQEGDKHALYYDAKVIDVQRNRHDSRGCRCRFWIRYDHDQFEEVVTLRKVCRRPETDGRLKENSDSGCQHRQSGREEHEEDGEDEDGDQEVDQGSQQVREEEQKVSEELGGMALDLNASPPVEQPAVVADRPRRQRRRK